MSMFVLGGLLIVVGGLGLQIASTVQAAIGLGLALVAGAILCAGDKIANAIEKK